MLKLIIIFSCNEYLKANIVYSMNIEKAYLQYKYVEFESFSIIIKCLLLQYIKILNDLNKKLPSSKNILPVSHGAEN